MVSNDVCFVSFINILDPFQGIYNVGHFLEREFKMLTTEVRETSSFFFQKPLRAIFSGSSQSGKTYLIGQILIQQRKLFSDDFSEISYYYPTYLDEPPVDFHSSVPNSTVQYICGPGLAFII